MKKLDILPSKHKYISIYVYLTLIKYTDCIDVAIKIRT